MKHKHFIEVSNTCPTITLKWKTHFCDLLNPNEYEQNNDFVDNINDIDTGMNGEITMLEVTQV